jgi:hypothetical protein
MAAHTPTPWAIRHGSHYDYIHAPIDNEGGIGRFVAKLPDDEQGKRDAAFIVRACNSHAALVGVHTAANRLLSLMVLNPNTDQPGALAIRSALSEAERRELEASMNGLFLSVAEASAASGHHRAIEQAENARAALSLAKQA